jgi:hypothetical protein
MVLINLMEKSINHFMFFSLSDLIQIILSVVGFGLAYFEIRKTKNAVNAASDATKDTLNSISIDFTIEDLENITSSFREIQISLRGKRYEAAIIRLQAVSNKLVKLKCRKSFSTEQRQSQIQSFVVWINRLQKKLEQAILDDSEIKDIPNINLKLSEFMNSIAGWGEETRFETRSNKNDS